MPGILLSKNLLTSFYIKQSGDVRKQEIRIAEDGDTLKVIGEREKGASFDFSFTILGFKRLN